MKEVTFVSDSGNKIAIITENKNKMFDVSFSLREFKQSTEKILYSERKQFTNQQDAEEYAIGLTFGE